jgi:S1-C subfamily serine protease
MLSAFLIFTVSSSPASAASKNMWGKIEIQKGMVGKVQILKDTDLFSVNKGKLKFIKKLKKGNEHGIFGESKSFGGVYKLSGVNVVKKSSSVKYLPVPKPTSKVYNTREIVNLNDSKIVLIHTDRGQGSGIVVGNGLILTNHHVIDGAKTATVTFNNGQKFDVKGIVESDAKKDVALLKTTKTFTTKTVVIRPSSKGLSKGENVVAIGSPQGLQNTVSEGIISSFRKVNGVSLIQTNADIDHGSSGGAMFDVRGQLIGMTSSGLDGVSANLNFAIATEEFFPLVKKYSGKKHASIKASFPIPAPSLQTPVLGNISLGMTMQQVKDLSGGVYYSEDKNYLYYSDVSAFGLLADVNYEFKNNKLISISVFHYIAFNVTDLDIIETYFDFMYAELSKIYGAADEVDSNWVEVDEGYVLTAYWSSPDHDTVLVVHVSWEDETFGGISISILE